MRDPARNRPEAIERWRRYIQRSISCISSTAVLYAGPAPSGGSDLVSLDSFEDPIRLRTSQRRTLFLSIVQRGRLIRDERAEHRGDWRVSTLAYRYAVGASDDPTEEPLIYWHWDVESGREPHVHAPIADPGRRGIRLHLPTGGRVSIEQVVTHLIEEWAVEPQREDWRDQLADAQARFDRYRVWDRPT